MDKEQKALTPGIDLTISGEDELAEKLQKVNEAVCVLKNAAKDLAMMRVSININADIYKNRQ